MDLLASACQGSPGPQDLLLVTGEKLRIYKEQEIRLQVLGSFSSTIHAKTSAMITAIMALQQSWTALSLLLQHPMMVIVMLVPLLVLLQQLVIAITAAI